MSAVLNIASTLAAAPLFWSGDCEMRLDDEPESAPISVTYGWTESQRQVVVKFPEGTIFESGEYIIERDPLNGINPPGADTVKLMASVSGAVGQSRLVGFEYLTYHKTENRIEVELDFHRAQLGENLENATLLCSIVNAFPAEKAA